MDSLCTNKIKFDLLAQNGLDELHYIMRRHKFIGSYPGPDATTSDHLRVMRAYSTYNTHLSQESSVRQQAWFLLALLHSINLMPASHVSWRDQYFKKRKCHLGKRAQPLLDLRCEQQPNYGGSP